MKGVAMAIKALWKIESTRLIVTIVRVTHDIGIAEGLTWDALATTLGCDEALKGPAAFRDVAPGASSAAAPLRR
jgi:hypothetical protein